MLCLIKVTYVMPYRLIKVIKVGICGVLKR